MQPRLEDWTAWRDLCARELCPAETQDRLGRFGRSRFGIQLKRYLASTNLSPGDTQRQLPTAEEAWHQFEAYAAVTQTRQGKRYKDWIFARIQNSSKAPLDTIQSGATLIMRDVVRTHLQNELTPNRTVSLDRPVGDGTSVLGDLLPYTLGNDESTEAREFDALAAAHAKSLFKSLSKRERLGLGAKYAGVTLEDPELLSAAGCGKSTLNQAVRDLLARVREDVVRKYGDDGHNTVMAFTTRMLRHLEQKFFLWKNSEKGLPRSFYSREGKNVGRET